jgi:hypothetical protein
MVVFSAIVIVSEAGWRPSISLAGSMNTPRRSTSLSGDANP